MREQERKKKVNKVKTFPVPFTLEEKKENKTIITNTPSKESKEKIINQAIHFHLKGNIQEAAKYYEYSINQGFNDYRVFSNYGTILKGLGKLKDAELSHRKAIQLNPNFAEAHSNLGNILKDLGQLKDAELYHRKAIQLKPDLAEAHCNLGIILSDLGKFKEAELFTRKAIELKPNYSEAHSNLGSILRDLGNLQEAEILTRKAIELNPYYAESHSNLGNILIGLGKLQEAELSIRNAIELKPHFAEAYSNLGNVLKDLGKSRKAENLYRKAIELKPDYAGAYYNLGNIFQDIGKYYEAINLYKEALKLDINLHSAKSRLITTSSQVCDWNNQDTNNEWLHSLGIEGEPVNPWNLFALEDNPLKHLQRSKNLYQTKFIRKEAKINSLNNKKIHIGYFSSDFRNHPTMKLISSILKLHDKSKFEIYLYSFPPKEDEYTEIAKNCGCIFRDIKRLNDIEAVELARKDKLDIAIDLNGYIKYHRMSIFSYRVAPIQINYLGFPGSVGSNTMDYIIADKIIIPKENEKFYSEKIIRIPSSYQCNDDTKAICKEKISKKDFNLPEQGFIFTCFNNNYKITKNEFNIWMRLLTEIEESVLWLYKSNQWSRKNLKKEALQRNIDPERLIFADKLPLNKHLARHSLGDLALDTFNCNGHTTTSDALWAGLPVITKVGASFAARVSASLLTAIGLPELITYSEKEYENKALYLARNPDQLLKLKSKLANSRKTSSLYDSKLFTKNLEDKFRRLVK